MSGLPEEDQGNGEKEPPAEDQEQTEEEFPLQTKISEAFATHPKTVLGAGIVAFLVLLGAASLLVWLGWFVAIPNLSSWGFDPPHAVRGTLAAIAIYFTAIVPPLSFWIPMNVVLMLLEASSKAERGELSERLSAAERRQIHIEEEIRDLLGDASTSTLLPLRISRWSSAQLEAIYSTGIDQARHSFRYSVLAMWLGFIVLVAGVAIQLLNPFERWGLQATTTDINFMVIAAGVIIEFIAALFLWVHRSALLNLARLYNAQMYRHSVILSNQLAEAITDGATRDESRRALIERLLVPPEAPKLDDPRSSSSSVVSKDS